MTERPAAHRAKPRSPAASRRRLGKIRDAVRGGTYENSLKWTIAVERLLRTLKSE